MALVEVTYSVGVSDGRGAGVDVLVKRGEGALDRVLETMGPTAMARRIDAMMKKMELVLKAYVKLQFATSGNAMSRLAGELGASGGSESPWDPLTDRTVGDRLKRRGYYDVQGSGELPRVWSGHSRQLALAAIRRLGNLVTGSTPSGLVGLPEATRPIYVASEVRNLAAAVAKQAFKGRDGKLPELTKGDSPFSFGVGERAPFDFGSSAPSKDARGGLVKRVVKGIRTKSVKDPEVKKLISAYKKGEAAGKKARAEARKNRKRMTPKLQQEYYRFLKEFKNFKGDLGE